jgi:hypothetical protein
MRYPPSTQQQQWYKEGALNAGFVMAVALRISGQIDHTALRNALDDIVVRHEILRTTIADDAGSVYQTVHQPSGVPLDIRDLHADSAHERKLRAEELLLEAEQSTLDVSDLPLLRAVLGKFDENDWVLTLVTHHAAGDAWSIQVVIRDLAECYAARVAKRSPALPRVRHYREYAAQQQLFLESAKFRVAREYWQRKLRDAGFSTLPTDRPVPERHTQPYKAYKFTIDPETMSMVSAFAKSVRMTNFMILLAGFNILYYKLTGSADPVINTIISGRDKRQFQDTVGSFLNFLPMRTDMESCGDFRELVDATRDTCLEAYLNDIPDYYIEQDVPSLLKSWEAPMASAFVLGYFKRPFDVATLQIADGSYEIRDRELGHASGELPGGASWTMSPFPSGELNGHIQYNPDEFDTDTIVGWTRSYREILANAVADPARPWRTVLSGG